MKKVVFLCYLLMSCKTSGDRSRLRGVNDEDQELTSKKWALTSLSKVTKCDSPEEDCFEFKNLIKNPNKEEDSFELYAVDFGEDSSKLQLTDSQSQGIDAFEKLKMYADQNSAQPKPASSPMGRTRLMTEGEEGCTWVLRGMDYDVIAGCVNWAEKNGRDINQMCEVIHQKPKAVRLNCKLVWNSAKCKRYKAAEDEYNAIENDIRICKKDGCQVFNGNLSRMACSQVNKWQQYPHKITGCEYTPAKLWERIWEKYPEGSKFEPQECSTTSEWRRDRY